MEHCFEVEFASALLEEILETLAKEVHHHHVIHLAILSLLIADEVKEGDEGLATQLVNQLALPEEHNVALHFYGFFLHSERKLINYLEKSEE